MWKRISRRLLSVVLVLCLMVNFGLPMASAADTGSKTDTTAFDNFVEVLARLEEYADAYVSANPDEGCDAFELVLNYCRTAKTEYTSSHWASLAGEENEAFAAYVVQQDEANGTCVGEIKTYSSTGNDFMYVANGNKVDVFHMFGTMNISYYWSSRYPETAARPYADLGGWAGDLVDLLTKSTDISGTPEEMTYEVYWNRLANDLGTGSFDVDDVYGDFDAYYFMQTHAATGEKLSKLMHDYYTPELTMADRAGFFTTNRFASGLSRTDLRAAVKDAYSTNILITALEGNEGLENVDAQRTACCEAFADYLYMLVNGPEFDVTATELTSGQKLSESTITGSASSVYGDPAEGTFAWKNGDTTLEKSGNYTAIFTPEDTFHYGVTELQIPVIVDGQPIDEPDPDPDPQPDPDPDPDPEPENSYFSTFYSTSSTLAPGLQQRILHTRTRDNKQMVIYAATIDVSRDDLALCANYNENDPTTIPTLAPVSDQMAAAQAKHSNPSDSEHYVENYNVVFGSNADFFTMSNGKPTSAFAMEGVVYTDAATTGSGSNNYFFAILKDGTPVISQNKTWGEYRDNCQEAVGGGALLVENGETKVSSSTNYYSSRAPRTCIGITADNKVVVMAIDGRQEPWSCGASAQEMAAAMISLGCVTAMNLDGGGSTTFVAKPEGEDTFRVINRPSDGYERRVSTSLMAVSTAPNTNVIDHATIQVEDEYLMPGASTQITMIGVNAAGGSAELPEDATFIVRDAAMGTVSDGIFTAGNQVGDVAIDVVSGDTVLGTTMLHVVIPDALAFEANEISVIYGQTIELPLTGYYNGNRVALDFGSDLLMYGLMNSAAGSITAAVLTAADDSCGVRSTDISAALVQDQSVYARATLYLYNEDEAVFDFNNATAGDHKLAWNREVSNSEKTRDENGSLDVYNLVEPGVPMDVNYTFAIDMNDLVIPENIKAALPVVASFLGVDASELGAWQLLLALAERVSPATTVTVKVNIDPRLELDLSDMHLNCEYFELTDQSFDEETSTLTLVAHWIKVYGPIDAATANPLCIVTGLKAHVKDGADWDENDRLTIVNGGTITYEAGIRSSQAYNLAGGALGQQYGLYPYDNTANLENDKGAMFSATHATFSDSFILDSTDYEGWVTTEDGTVFYYVNNRKLTGIQKVPTPEGDKELYYSFANNGVLQGKYSGALELENGLHYIVLGEEITGWYELDDGIHYFSPKTGASVTGTQTIDGFTYVFENYVLVRGEFRQLSTGAWRYRWAGQWYAKGWFEVDGKKYFAIRGGNLHTGIQNVEKIGETGTEAVRFHLFDDHGVWQENANGLYLNIDGKTYLAETGFMVPYPGLVQIDGDYYYFTSKNYMVQGTDYWVSKTNGLLPAARYTFAADGKLILGGTEPEPDPKPDDPTPTPDVKNGIYAEDDSLYYYKDGSRYYAGLIIIDGDYYYVRTGGEVVHGRRYTVSKNNGLLPIKQYLFADDGKLILDETPTPPDDPTPTPDVKNGIYAEDDSLYYYKDGSRYYAGLIVIDGDYYYVRTGGEVVHGRRYTVSKNNGLLPIKQYLFADDGKLILDETPTPPDDPTPTPDVKNGIYAEDDSLFYYKDGSRYYAGLIIIDGDYYYVRTGGEVVHGRRYTVSKNNGLLPIKQYLFADDGKLIFE